MNSMIVLSALLGLAVAVPSAYINDGLVLNEGLGYGLGVGHGIGLVNAAPLSVGYGVATNYASRVAHPSVHGGIVGIRSYAAPAVISAPIIKSYAAPAVISAPIVKSYAAPAVLSGAVVSSYSGHGLIGGRTLIGGHGLAAPLALGKVW